MAKFKSFEEIIAWQNSRELNIEIYAITNQKDFAKDFALRDQLRRSIISVSSNIVEGFERETSKEFKRFLYIAKASIGEERSQLYLSNDIKYISNNKLEELLQKTTGISKMLSGLIKYLTKLETKSL
jgi:four helix bundle protein